MTDRSVPHSNEAEQSALGAAMLAGPYKIGWLTEADFFTEQHQLIWRAIQDCDRSGDGCDSTTVTEWFRASGQFDMIGSGAYLTMLVNETPGPANMVGYAKIIRDHSKRRRLIDLSADIGGRALGGEDPSDTVRHIESQVIDWSVGGTRGPRSILEAAGSWFDRLGKMVDQAKRINTGLVDVDDILIGMQPSELILVAGRPGMGKTAAMLTMARNISTDHPVLLFSAEMSDEQLVKRMISHNVDGKKLRDPSKLTPEDWNSVRDGTRNLKNFQIYVDDTAGINIFDLVARAKAWKKQHDIRAIFVDYVGLLDCDAENRTNEISKISRQLKGLAKSLDIPVIALVQLNRKVEDRPDKRPRLADLRESGQLEQDADIIIFLYRHGYYHDDCDSPVAEWITAKHRDAEPGTAFTLWQPHTQTFLNAHEDLIAEYKVLATEQPRSEGSRFQRTIGETA